MLAEYHHCQHLISKQWMIQQHCCCSAVFGVDVDPFQKKKKKTIKIGSKVWKIREKNVSIAEMQKLVNALLLVVFTSQKMKTLISSGPLLMGDQY